MANSNTLLFNRPNNDTRYYTKSDIDTKFNDYYTKANIDAAFNSYYTKSDIDDKNKSINDSITEWASKLNDCLKLTGGTMTGNIYTNGGAVFATDGNVYLKSGGYADWLTNILNSKIPTSASCNKNWNWSGLGGQPTWLWGGEDGVNMYVYNPSNFTVYRCTGGINKGGNGVGISSDATYFRSYNNAGQPIDNAMGCGSSGARWTQVYSVKSTLTTSDRNLKNSIAEIDPRILQLILSIDPKQYKLNGGDRTHTGLIAQDVEEKMTKLGLTAEDVAALCKDPLRHYEDGQDEDSDDTIVKDEDGNIIYRYGLRYEELISPILQLVQLLWKAVYGDTDIMKVLSDSED